MNCSDDVDGDGDVSIIDATLIQRYLVGIPTRFDIGEIIKTDIISHSITITRLNTKGGANHSALTFCPFLRKVNSQVCLWKLVSFAQIEAMIFYMSYYGENNIILI